MSVTEGLQGIDLLASTWGRGVPHDQFGCGNCRCAAPAFAPGKLT